VSWSTHVAPMLLTIVLWWGSTALIARLVGRAPRTYGRLLLLTTICGLVGLALVVGLRDVTTGASAMTALVAALAIWGWIEVTFLTGKVTGPEPVLHGAAVARRLGSGLLRRAVDAITAILWHELLIAGTVALVALLLVGSANDLALLVLLLLWLMRSSAKLNLFLGVRNLGGAFLPPHLQHLLEFMRQRPMNPLLPVSVALGVAIAWQCGSAALAADAPHAAAAYSILATLALLAVLEHLLMVLPVPAEALWRWSLANRRAAP
jgi:putative photosynthetic complex assembly protein 2